MGLQRLTRLPSFIVLSCDAWLASRGGRREIALSVTERAVELRYRLSSKVSAAAAPPAGSLFFLLASHMAVQRAVMTATMMSAR